MLALAAKDPESAYLLAVPESLSNLPDALKVAVWSASARPREENNVAELSARSTHVYTNHCSHTCDQSCGGGDGKGGGGSFEKSSERILLRTSRSYIEVRLGETGEGEDKSADERYA